MSTANTFDTKCYDLASHFLFDQPAVNTEAARVTLASIIQDAIETEIAVMRGARDKKLMKVESAVSEQIIRMTRSEFVDLIGAALVEAVYNTPAVTRLHLSTARYMAADAFDRAAMRLAISQEELAQ